MKKRSEHHSTHKATTREEVEFVTLASPQLEEVLSWRFITELWRRCPDRFDLIEAHPCDGQYDCLALCTKGQNPAIAIDVNRGGGSVHIHKYALGLEGDMAYYPDWMARVLAPEPERFLDDIAREARLPVPKKLPTSTPAILTCRYISDFLTHSIGKREHWQCRNGFEDSSGFVGGGIRRMFFDKFSFLGVEELRKSGNPRWGHYEYNFWFLVKGEDPMLCLDTSGRVFRRDGTWHDLSKLYQRDRRIWALICATALDILP
jgi:hypothetical protein